MSTNCGICSLPCSEECDLTKCSGECGKLFHSRCVKGDIEGTKTRSNKDWKCKDCRGTSSVHSSVGSVSAALTKEFLISVLESFKSDVFAEFKTFKSEMEELTTSVKFLSDKLDESTALWKEVKTELADVKKENCELQAKNAILTNEVGLLKNKVRSLEQYSRTNNIEISGLPVSPGENVFDLIKDVGSALGVDVRESDISAAHRVPSFNKKRAPSLVVQFVNRTSRDTWIREFREKKEIIAHQINSAFPKQKVYVNEHLSPDNKVFLSQLKEKCKTVGYSYAWCRDGKFFVRKAQGEKYKRIDTYEDLYNLR